MISKNIEKFFRDRIILETIYLVWKYDICSIYAQYFMKGTFKIDSKVLEMFEE